MILSKSDYLRYRQCPKYLWLHKKRKDLLEEVSEGQQAIFDQGYEVESYAQQLFKNGKSVSDDIFKAEKETVELVKNGAEVIFQATAIAGQLLIRADIFSFNHQTGSWDIYEVKSSTEVKEVHLLDLCFQKLVFEKAGYKVGKTFLVHVNNEYVRNGEIKPDQLLMMEDVTDEIKTLENEVESDIPKALELFKIEQEPQVRILKQCFSPYECPFVSYCWKDIPDYSVYDLKRVKENQLIELVDMGIMEIQNIPEDFKLSESQINQVTVAQTRKAMIDQESIENTLKNLEYPLYFLDYETFGSAIPLFDEVNPYQQICFQYSLHILRDEKNELEHREFLARGQDNPIPELLKKLRADIDEDGGTVIVWNKSFEMSRNTEMGEMFPEYQDFLEGVNARVFDLMEIFRKQYYVHPDFKGSCSIKDVLPVLVPELSHKNLEIQGGGTASLSWHQMNFENLPTKDQQKIYENLLKYCGLDTLAMVRIFERLLE